MRRIVTLLLPALLVSCAPPTTDREILRYGLTLAPSGLDPHINASSELTIPLGSVYDTLVFQDPDSGAFVPGLASSGYPWQGIFALVHRRLLADTG